MSAAPWRVLIFDASGDEPQWAIATVTTPGDVRPAVTEPDSRRYADWVDVTAWVRERIGPAARLTPASISVWRITGEAAAER